MSPGIVTSTMVIYKKNAQVCSETSMLNSENFFSFLIDLFKTLYLWLYY